MHYYYNYVFMVCETRLLDIFLTNLLIILYFSYTGYTREQAE